MHFPEWDIVSPSRDARVREQSLISAAILLARAIPIRTFLDFRL